VMLVGDQPIKSGAEWDHCHTRPLKTSNIQNSTSTQVPSYTYEDTQMDTGHEGMYKDWS